MNFYIEEGRKVVEKFCYKEINFIYEDRCLFLKNILKVIIFNIEVLEIEFNGNFIGYIIFKVIIFFGILV